MRVVWRGAEETSRWYALTSYGAFEEAVPGAEEVCVWGGGRERWARGGCQGSYLPLFEGPPGEWGGVGSKPTQGGHLRWLLLCCVCGWWWWWGGERVRVYQESGVYVRGKEARTNWPNCLPADTMASFGSLQNESEEEVPNYLARGGCHCLGTGPAGVQALRQLRSAPVFTDPWGRALTGWWTWAQAKKARYHSTESRSSSLLGKTGDKRPERQGRPPAGLLPGKERPSPWEGPEANTAEGKGPFPGSSPLQ